MNRSKRQVQKKENELRHYSGTMVSRTNRNNDILGQNKSNDAMTDKGITLIHYTTLAAIQAAGTVSGCGRRHSFKRPEAGGPGESDGAPELWGGEREY